MRVGVIYLTSFLQVAHRLKALLKEKDMNSKMHLHCLLRVLPFDHGRNTVISRHNLSELAVFIISIWLVNCGTILSDRDIFLIRKLWRLPRSSAGVTEHPAVFGYLQVTLGSQHILNPQGV